MWSYGWIADYPDGDNFMQLLYGGNIGQSNVACYASPTFDALYEKSRLLPDSPDRDTLYEQMTRQFEADMPWRLGTANYQNTLAQPHVIGYKAHPVLLAEWIYVDVERRSRRRIRAAAPYCSRRGAQRPSRPRAPLADHQRRGIRVGGRDRRHHRRVDDAQPLDAAHAQLRIDDGERIRLRRPSGTCRRNGTPSRPRGARSRAAARPVRASGPGSISTSNSSRNAGCA